MESQPNIVYSPQAKNKLLYVLIIFAFFPLLLGAGIYLYNQKTPPQTSTSLNSSLTLPIPADDPAVTNFYLTYILRGQIDSISHDPVASSSAITVHLKDSSKTQSFDMPWNRQIAYGPNLGIKTKPKVSDLKNGALIEFFLSFDPKTMTSTVGQILILKP